MQKLSPGTDSANELSPAELSDVRQRGYQAYLRDLPRLLETHPDQWVAYAGDTRLGIRPSKRSFCSELIVAGYAIDDFEIFSIEPHQEWDLDDLIDT